MTSTIAQRLRHPLRIPSLALCIGAVCAAILVACGGGNDSNITLPNIVKTAQLSGDQQTPAVTTGAIGTGTLTLDPNTLALSGSITLDGMTATQAHIHEAAPGSAGSVVVDLAAGSGGTWTVPAGAVLTTAQAASFKAGNLYFNAHSSAAPAGEVRGQIGLNIYSTTASSAQNVVAAGSTAPVSSASAHGFLAVDPDTKIATGSFTTTGLSATAAHVHQGAVGTNGSVVLELSEATAGSGIWRVAANSQLTDAQVQTLKDGGMYFNAHTAAYPAGEIRGQIHRKPGFAALTGDQQVPSVTTTSTGSGTLVVNPADRSVSGKLSLRGFTATMAHVHQAPSGSNGNVVLDLSASGSGWSVASGAQLSAAQYLAFQKGDLYFNAHSTSFPAGEVRGKITAK